MEYSNLLKVKIREIGPGAQDLLLTGVIIRKQDCRVVHIRKGLRILFTLYCYPLNILFVQTRNTDNYIKILFVNREHRKMCLEFYFKRYSF